MSIIYINSYQFAAAAPPGGYDADALDYIARVEAADLASGSPGGLETAVKDAINAFFVGCKADGIFNAIKTGCIMAGALSVQGALQPIITGGQAPTNIGFGQGDYNRKTGLKGNGSSAALNSNRPANADPQNSKHVAVYATQVSTVTSCLIGNRPSSATDATQVVDSPSTFTRTKVNGNTFGEITGAPAPGFFGGNRTSSSSLTVRANGTSNTVSATSAAPGTETAYVFARNTGGAIDARSNARLAFYSIGESINLQLLDARVTTLINAFASAIP